MDRALASLLRAGVATCMTLISIGLVTAQSHESAELTVQLKVHKTNVWKGVHGPTEPSAGAGQHIAVGQSGRMFYAVGTFDDQDNAIPSFLGTIGSDKTTTEQDLIGKYPHAWWVEARVLSIGADGAEIELDWRHTYSPTRGAPTRAGGDLRRISLKEKERHVFDFFEQSMHAVQYDANAVLGITYKIRHQPEL